MILEGGYEPGDFPSYLRPGPFAPEIEPALVNTALALAQDLATGAADHTVRLWDRSRGQVKATLRMPSFS